MTLTFDNLQYSESPTKTKRRKMLLKACFEVASESKIKNLTIESVMHAINFEVRTFYNYYPSLNHALEDVMIEAMKIIYDPNHYTFENIHSLYEFYETLGTQFITHLENHPKVVAFADEYDHLLVDTYYTNKYAQLVLDLKQTPKLVLAQNQQLLSLDFFKLDETLSNNIEFFISTLFVYESRLIRRKSIYDNEVTFIKKENIYMLLKMLCASLSK